MVSDHRDAIRRRVASVMLEAVADTDFVLTGASALIEHGLINRPTDDVDLFSTRKDEGRVPEAVARMQAALEARGATVETTDVFPGFSTGTVHWGDVDVEFDVGIDWRAYDAITLDIGRVLDVRDSIGSKTAALYSRYELRDYMDVAAIILDGRWTPEQVMQMGANNDPGFDRDRLANVVLRDDHIPGSEDFREYGIDQGVEGRMRDALTALRCAALGQEVDLEAIEATRASRGGRLEPLRDQLANTQQGKGAPVRVRQLERGQGEEPGYGR